jgi:hypothetical protein
MAFWGKQPFAYISEMAEKTWPPLSTKGVKTHTFKMLQLRNQSTDFKSVKSFFLS